MLKEFRDFLLRGIVEGRRHQELLAAPNQIGSR